MSQAHDQFMCKLYKQSFKDYLESGLILLILPRLTYTCIYTRMATKTWSHVNIYVESGTNEDCWTCKRYAVKKCMAFSVSVLSHAAVTSNFKYGMLLYAHNWLNTSTMTLACKTSKLCFFISQLITIEEIADCWCLCL